PEPQLADGALAPPHPLSDFRERLFLLISPDDHVPVILGECRQRLPHPLGTLVRHRTGAGRRRVGGQPARVRRARPRPPPPPAPPARVAGVRAPPPPASGSPPPPAPPPGRPAACPPPGTPWRSRPGCAAASA